MVRDRMSAMIPVYFKRCVGKTPLSLVAQAIKLRCYNLPSQKEMYPVLWYGRVWRRDQKTGLGQRPSSSHKFDETPFLQRFSLLCNVV